VNEERHIIVTGVVQGVGFRAAVKRHAIGYQIKGYVRNLPDGRVEICVQGTPARINAFVETIQAKPGLGRIDVIEVTQRKATSVFDSFEVI
jgi:acylphosphatase